MVPIGARVLRPCRAVSSISPAASRRPATPKASSARSCSPGALPATRSTASSSSRCSASRRSILWIPLAVTFLSGRTLFAILVVGFAWGVCFFGPDIVLDNRITKRREEIERRLPDTLDLLVISVEAGLGFEQALERTATAVPGPLSENPGACSRKPAWARAGPTRCAHSTSAPGRRPPHVHPRHAAGRRVRCLDRPHPAFPGRRIRVRRRQYAQEQSQKAPIKMLFPLAVCIFPAVFVVVLLPAVLDLQGLLRHSARRRSKIGSSMRSA